MRTLAQPGEALNPRRLAVSAESGADWRVRLPAGADLLNGLVAALSAQGVRQAAVSILGGCFAQVAYLTGQPDRSGERVATYGEPTHLAGPVMLLGANAILGMNPKDEPLIHCHAVLVDRDGRLHGGHLPPGAALLGGDGAVALVSTLTDGGFKVAYDSETNYPLFHPQTAAGEVLS